MALSDVALIDLFQAKAYLRVDAAASLKVEAEYVGMGNGTNKAFTLDYTPIEGSLKLYVDNALQTETTHYTISGVNITFVTAPGNGKIVTASYDKAASANTFESYDDALLERLIEAATKKAEDYTGRAFVQRSITESHNGNGSKVIRIYKQPVSSMTSVSYKRIVRSTGDGATVAFSLGYTPKSGSLTVYVDGVLKTITTDYTLSGSVVTFVIAPADDTEIIFRFEVSLVLSSSYFEQLHIGRLKGTWYKNYEYQVVYNAGYGTTRATTQALVPDAVAAVLEILSDLFENRSDRIDSLSISGLSSVSYKLPSRALELLNPLRVNVL